MTRILLISLAVTVLASACRAEISPRDELDQPELLTGQKVSKREADSGGNSGGRMKRNDYTPCGKTTVAYDSWFGKGCPPGFVCHNGICIWAELMKRHHNRRSKLHPADITPLRRAEGRF